MTDIKSMYTSVIAGAGDTLDKVLCERQQQLSSAHNEVGDILAIIKVVGKRDELAIYNSAVHDMKMSLFLVAIGAYRQSYTTLRKALESFVAGCSFSSNLLDLRLWEMGEKDIRWSQITEGANGVFSDTFVQAFCSEIREEVKAYELSARHVYRDLSGFVHGEKRTTYSDNLSFSYSNEELDIFFDKFSQAAQVILFILSLRYLSEFSASEIGAIDQIINDHFGHFSAFQKLIGGQTGAT